MKKTLLSFIALLTYQISSAQDWSSMPQANNNLEAIKNLIEKSETPSNVDENESNGEIVKEKDNYHFNRWYYHWQHHLDENGNMVSPMATFNEWNRYKTSLKKSQTKNKTTANQSDWIFKGPTTSPGGYNGIGRINVVEFHPTDTNTFIVGTAGGGAWRTTNGGLNWTSLYDNLPVLGVSDIKYNPQNPATIYLCTGDRDASDTYSVGLLRSYNNGLSWDTTGLKFNITDFALLNELLINPLDTNSMLAATSLDLRKSYDGGITWNTVVTGHFKDIVYNPIDTNIIYAATYTSGNARIYRSLDGGATWSITANFFSGNRIAMAVTPANPSVVKAVVSMTNTNGLLGIYNSTDTGATFTKIYGTDNDCSTNILSGSLNLSSSSCSGQGWYDLCMAINPINENIVLVGGVNTYQSTDGGTTWNKVTQWYNGSPGTKTVHADKHYMAFHPLKPSLLFECNDGGIYKTANPASLLWNDLSNGLGITQFYRNAISNIAPFVIGGAQDNGTKRITFGGVYNELTGGDGMDCQMDYNDPTVFYTSSQYGSISKTIDNGGNYVNISNNIPGNPDGAWITPFVLHAQIPEIIYAGYDHVYVSYDRGDSWTDISPNFPISGTQLRRLAVTPLDEEMIVALGGTNTVRYTKNSGLSWTTIPVGFSGSISDVMIDPWDKNKIWFTYSGYGNAKVATYSIGGTWALRNDSLPNIPIYCITIDSSNGTKYIGTDAAVFYKDTSMNKWELYNIGLPVIEVTDLAINYTTNEIWGSTYGRGMWVSPKHLTQPPAAISNVPFAANVIKTAPNPNNGKFILTTENEYLLQSSNLQILIKNMNGNTVASFQKRFNASNKIEIDLNSVSSGNYIVEVIKEGITFAREKIQIFQ